VLLSSLAVVVGTVLPWAMVNLAGSTTGGPGGAGRQLSMWQIPGGLRAGAAIVAGAAMVGVGTALWLPERSVAPIGAAVAVVAGGVEMVTYQHVRSAASPLHTVSPAVGFVLTLAVLYGLITWGALSRWPSPGRPIAGPARLSSRVPSAPIGPGLPVPAWSPSSGAEALHLAVRADPPLPGPPRPDVTAPADEDDEPALPSFWGGPSAAAAFVSDELARSVVGSPSPVSVRSPAGWYEDYGDPSLERYFDGARWTEDTAPR